MVIPLLTITAVFLTALAEALHWLRIRRVRGLVFGRQGPRLWTYAAPAVRCVGAGLLCWGLLTLLSIDSNVAPAKGSAKKDAEPEQHLVIALDVSPSIFIEDAGPSGTQRRGERARDILRSLLDRLDTRKIRVSVVAFYTTAKPVIVDAQDMAVILNVIGDLPLQFAFKDGETNMYAGVREAAALAKNWKPASTTLVVVSDGDTLPDAKLDGLPPSIADTLVIGVGNSSHGTSIAGRSSRQDVLSLRMLATRLRGAYYDGNTRQVPSSALSALAMLSQPSSIGVPLRTLALIASGVGAALVSLITPALALLGLPGAMARAERGARRNAQSRRASPPARVPPAFAGDRA